MKLSELPDDYEELLAPHRQEHRRMFNRMQLDLGCAKEGAETPIEKLLEVSARQGVTPLFLEQVQAMGRYLLISSSGKYAPALQATRLKGVRLYGGHTLDIAWKEGKVVSATLLAGSDEEVVCVNGDREKTLRLRKGEKYIL